MIDKRKVFLASSEELVADRREFEIFVGRKNKDWIDKGVFIELNVWEDFLDALSPTRLQDEYNRVIRQCDLFVMLFWTRVGRFTDEEFDVAIGTFQARRKPFIFTYYKDAPAPGGTTDPAHAASLAAFQDKLKRLGHYQTRYRSVEGLLHHFDSQLDKLVANGFIRFEPDARDWDLPAGAALHAQLNGSGAIAQGPNATAIGAGGVAIRGNNTGDINTGTRIGGDYIGGNRVAGDKIGTSIDTGGGTHVGGNVDLGGGMFVGRDYKAVQAASGSSPGNVQTLFAGLQQEAARRADPTRIAEALRHAKALQGEAVRGPRADDARLAELLALLVDLAPGIGDRLAALFAEPALATAIGPITRIVLDRLAGR